MKESDCFWLLDWVLSTTSSCREDRNHICFAVYWSVSAVCVYSPSVPLSSSFFLFLPAEQQTLPLKQMEKCLLGSFVFHHHFKNCCNGTTAVRMTIRINSPHYVFTVYSCVSSFICLRNWIIFPQLLRRVWPQWLFLPEANGRIISSSHNISQYFLFLKINDRKGNCKKVWLRNKQ